MFSYSKYNINNDSVNFGTFEDCPILHTKVQVLRPFATSGNQKEYQKYISRYGYHSGIDLVPYSDSDRLSKDDYTISVYSPALGVVLSVNDYVIPENATSGATKSVVVQYDAETSFRVGNLTETFVSPGELISQYDVVGKANKWVHFEMLTYGREYENSQIFVFDKLRLFLSNPTEYFKHKYSRSDPGIGGNNADI